jgi:CheY-like chemotaxis protein
MLTPPSTSLASPIPFLSEVLGQSTMNPREKNLRSSSQSKPRTLRNIKRNRVLLFGRFRELALYRAEVLRSEGFAVVTPFSREESLAAVRRGHFDIAILTYTLPSETVQELAELIREYCPECPIIAISTSKKEDREIDPDEIVVADEGPPALLAALRKAARRH